MRSCSRVGSSLGWVIPVSQALGYLGNLGKLGRNTSNHVQGHMKSNSKSSAPCFSSSETVLSFGALCGSSYTCFTGTWVLEQFGEIGPEYPKSCAGTNQK